MLPRIGDLGRVSLQYSGLATVSHDESRQPVRHLVIVQQKILVKC
jgi:hypothetical protein